MASPSLLLAAVVALAAASAYAYVAARLVQVNASRERALSLFAVWWGALALNLGLLGVTQLLAAFGALTFEIQLVDSYLQRLLLAVSMVGLMHYLLYVLTGRDLLVPLCIVYAGHFALVTAAMFHQQPLDVYVGAWRTDLVFAREAPSWTRLVILGAILVPPVGAAIAYFALVFRVDDNTRRWRIALVSAAIVGWWAVAVWAGQRSVVDNGPLQSVHRVLSLLAALAVLAAYAPPGWAQRRWGIRTHGASSSG